MNYYTETIPLPLAEKLEEKGMPMPVEFIPNYLGDPEGEAVSKIVPPSFAFVFDWLMSEKGIILYPDATYKHFFWRIETTKGILQTEEFESWHEAANAAIEMSLTLI